MERLRELAAGWDSLRCANAVNVDRLRGDIALGLGRLDEAQRLYDIGLAWCERERCPIEQGRNLQGLAEIALRRGEQQQAMEYLDRAWGAVLAARREALPRPGAGEEGDFAGVTGNSVPDSWSPVRSETTARSFTRLPDEG